MKLVLGLYDQGLYEHFNDPWDDPSAGYCGVPSTTRVEIEFLIVPTFSEGE